MLDAVEGALGEDVDAVDYVVEEALPSFSVGFKEVLGTLGQRTTGG